MGLVREAGQSETRQQQRRQKVLNRFAQVSRTADLIDSISDSINSI